jgi:hypothetical protein
MGFIMITAQYLAMSISAKTICLPDFQLTVERHNLGEWTPVERSKDSN